MSLFPSFDDLYIGICAKGRNTFLAQMAKNFVDIHGRNCHIRYMNEFKERGRVERIVWELGGEKAVATAMGVNRATVRYWIDQDRVPGKRQAALMAIVKAAGVPVRAEDLIG